MKKAAMTVLGVVCVGFATQTHVRADAVDKQEDDLVLDAYCPDAQAFGKCANYAAADATPLDWETGICDWLGKRYRAPHRCSAVRSQIYATCMNLEIVNGEQWERNGWCVSNLDPQ